MPELLFSNQRIVETDRDRDGYIASKLLKENSSRRSQNSPVRLTNRSNYGQGVITVSNSKRSKTKITTMNEQQLKVNKINISAFDEL